MPGSIPNITLSLTNFLKAKISYKYINLLIRAIIGLGAFVFIAVKLYTYLKSTSFELLKMNEIKFYLLFIALLLVVVNWGTEALKWKYLIRKLAPISLKKAFNLVITGITIGLITPNRVGEIPARVFLLPNITNKKALLTATFIGAFSQLLVTVFTGFIAIYFYKDEVFFSSFSISIRIFILICLLGLIYSYFFPFWITNLLKKIPFLSKNEHLVFSPLFSKKEKLNALIMSVFRYAVFFFQYYLILEAFGVHFNNFSEMVLIAVCFLFTSIIPTFILSEIAVRGSVALLVFSFLSDNDVAILTASILLWVFNVALPASIGIFGLTKIQLPQKS